MNAEPDNDPMDNLPRLGNGGDSDVDCDSDGTPSPTKGDASGKLGHHDAASMTEEEFLEQYKAQEYPKPSVTVDLVIFTIIDCDLKVLLITRGGHPFRLHQATPGGFVNVKTPEEERGQDYDYDKDQGEDLEAAAHRELAEETGLPKGTCYLEQLYTFGDAYRDPRTRTISVAYIALVRPTLAALVVAGDDALSAEWVSVQEIADKNIRLAFDHNKILDMAVKRIRGKIDYTSIAFDLVPETFTVTDLRVVYEAVKGVSYDSKNFYRRFRRMVADGVILPATGKRPSGTKHAAVYRFNR